MTDNNHETALFAEQHDLRDDFADALDDFIDNVMTDWLPYAQSVISAETAATFNRATALNTLLTDVVKAGTKQVDDNRDSWHTFKLRMVGLEDGMMTAYANDLKAQSVLATVNSDNTLAASPLSNFESQIGQTATTGQGISAFRLGAFNTLIDERAFHQRSVHPQGNGGSPEKAAQQLDDPVLHFRRRDRSAAARHQHAMIAGGPLAA